MVNDIVQRNLIECNIRMQQTAKNTKNQVEVAKNHKDVIDNGDGTTFGLANDDKTGFVSSKWWDKLQIFFQNPVSIKRSKTITDIIIDGDVG